MTQGLGKNSFVGGIRVARHLGRPVGILKASFPLIAFVQSSGAISPRAILTLNSNHWTLPFCSQTFPSAILYSKVFTQNCQLIMYALTTMVMALVAFTR